MVHSIKGINNKVLLIILDGFGLSDNSKQNAIKDATTPTIDSILKTYPWTKIEPGGEAVGLPKGVVGNSEVGHMNLGAGRPVRQDLVRINESIKNNQFAKLEKIEELIKNAKSSTRRIHLFGLLSDGGVHSHINHIKEVIKVLSKHEELEIYFHAFMDGRDTQRDCGAKYIEELNSISGFQFASMQGRSIGMDRDRRWEKIKLCYDTITGNAQITNLTPLEYLKSEYANERFDEFVAPVLFNKDFALNNNDSIFFLNFRPDRAIQFSLALNDESFKEFDRPVRPSYYLCMVPYVPDEVELPILFDKEKIKGGLSEYLSSINKKQFKIAETEKYAHVTYFFNGGEKKPFNNEDHVLVPSPKDVSTYDQKPEMSATLVTNELERALKEGNHDFYLVNFANSDMVGHTGNYEAAVKAIEVLDKCIQKLLRTCEEEEITMIITADHGNSDQMTYPDGSPHTSHTGSMVPFIIVDKSLKNLRLQVSEQRPLALKDVAPTVLNILGIDQPKEFTGNSIFK